MNSIVNIFQSESDTDDQNWPEKHEAKVNNVKFNKDLKVNFSSRHLAYDTEQSDYEDLQIQFSKKKSSKSDKSLNSKQKSKKVEEIYKKSDFKILGNSESDMDVFEGLDQISKMDHLSDENFKRHSHTFNIDITPSESLQAVYFNEIQNDINKNNNHISIRESIQNISDEFFKTNSNFSFTNSKENIINKKSIKPENKLNKVSVVHDNPKEEIGSHSLKSVNTTIALKETENLFLKLNNFSNCIEENLLSDTLTFPAQNEDTLTFPAQNENQQEFKSNINTSEEESLLNKSESGSEFLKSLYECYKQAMIHNLAANGEDVDIDKIDQVIIDMFKSGLKNIQAQSAKDDNCSTTELYQSCTLGDISSEKIINNDGQLCDNIIITNAWHAIFTPLKSNFNNSDNNINLDNLEPAQQFESVKKILSEPYESSELFLYSSRKIYSATELNIPRNPLQCPITTCKNIIFMSDYIKHIKIDHPKIPILRIKPGKHKNIFIDPKIDRIGVNKCHCLFLVTDKIKDFGSNEYKNYLPVLLMSTKINLITLLSSLSINTNDETTREIQDEIENIERICDKEYLVIWLTGLSHPDLPINYCITAWPRYSNIPECHLTRSGKLYSIRNEQTIKDLYENGHAMFLSPLQVDLLTDNGINMIEFQIMIN